MLKENSTLFIICMVTAASPVSAIIVPVFLVIFSSMYGINAWVAFFIIIISHVGKIYKSLYCIQKEDVSRETF